MIVHFLSTPHRMSVLWGRPCSKWYVAGMPLFISLLAVNQGPFLKVLTHTCSHTHTHTPYTSLHLLQCTQIHPEMSEINGWRSACHFFCSENQIFPHDVSISGVRSKLKMPRSSDTFCSFELWELLDETTEQERLSYVFLWSH